MSDKVFDFDFDKWFVRRFSPHTPQGEVRRRGTFTLEYDRVLEDLTYDYARATGVAKNSGTVCSRAIRASMILSVDAEGYFLTGEPRLQKEGSP